MKNLQFIKKNIEIGRKKQTQLSKQKDIVSLKKDILNDIKHTKRDTLLLQIVNLKEDIEKQKQDIVEAKKDFSTYAKDDFCGYYTNNDKEIEILERMLEKTVENYVFLKKFTKQYKITKKEIKKTIIIKKFGNDINYLFKDVIKICDELNEEINTKLLSSGEKNRKITLSYYKREAKKVLFFEEDFFYYYVKDKNKIIYPKHLKRINEINEIIGIKPILFKNTPLDILKIKKIFIENIKEIENYLNS